MRPPSSAHHPWRLEYDPLLPITEHRPQLLEALTAHQVLVVCGETGSGKSTQLPKLCLEARPDLPGLIGHTQPRRLAARSIAQRLSQELGSPLGETVGFKIRFNDRTGEQTRVKLMTDGVLLAEIPSDPQLRRYHTLIIDEAHERSLNIDLLLAHLHSLLDQRPELRVIITSATIDAERFAAHFSHSQRSVPIIQVSGRTYPVELRYQPPAEASSSGTRGGGEGLGSDDEAAMAAALEELMGAGPGDILVFLPTERHIRDLVHALGRRLVGGRGHRRGNAALELLPLYARLSEAEQQRIFAPHAGRRIVLATNVAESSLTVPGIRYVVDSGLARISRYSPRSRLQRLPIEPVAQASADQRAGRCGRLGPGICIRLYSQEDYAARARFTTPEILRTDLAGAILRAEHLGLGRLDQLPLLDPPRNDQIQAGYRTLHEIGAIDDRRALTPIGRRLALWPVSPRVGRMMIEGDARGCLADVLIIAAALEVQDPRLRPPEQAQAADAAHAQFKHPQSDFVSFLMIWDFYHRLKEELSRGRLQRAMQQNFLSLPRLREWAEVYRQLQQMVQQQGLRAGPRRYAPPYPNPPKRGWGEAYQQIHTALLTGLLSGIANHRQGPEYNGAGGLQLQLWPGSGLAPAKRLAEAVGRVAETDPDGPSEEKPSWPKWIVMAELVETHRRYGRTVAAINVDWLPPLAQHLLKHQHSDPFFSQRLGRGQIYRRSSLFGLPVVPRHPIALSQVDPQLARQLLIQEGLVEGGLNSPAGLYRHNQQLLSEVADWAAKTRQRELVVDRFFLERFYQDRVPMEVVDRPSFERWAATQTPPDADGQVPPESAYLSWQRLSEEFDPQQSAAAFPEQVELGGNRLPLVYRFEPGSETDGVTVQLPQPLLGQLQSEQLDWMVPGLLPEKIQELIRALPKPLRRGLVPAPQTADEVARHLLQLPSPRPPFWPTLCQELTRRGGQPIRMDDFRLDKLSDHLRPRVEVIGAEGEIVAAGRELPELQRQLASQPQAPQIAATIADDPRWHQTNLRSFPESGLPEQVVTDQAGLRLLRYPMLCDTGQAVELRLAADAYQAECLSAEGLTRLFAIQCHRQIKSYLRDLPGLERYRLQLGLALGGAPLPDWLHDRLARLAFVEGEPAVRSLEQFQERVGQAARRLSMAVQSLADWLKRLAESYHLLMLSLERGPSETAASVRTGVERLLSSGRLRLANWDWLSQYPRYLSAMEHRLERARSGGLARDQQQQAIVDHYLADYQRRSELPAAAGQWPSPELLEYGWMIEELAVSIHAQQLGTRRPVSAKRLDRLAAKLS
jgi:ATP-dependent helicase HrpA